MVGKTDEWPQPLALPLAERYGGWPAMGSAQLSRFHECELHRFLLLAEPLPPIVERWLTHALLLAERSYRLPTSPLFADQLSPELSPVVA